MPPTPAKLWGARDVGARSAADRTRSAACAARCSTSSSAPALDRLPALTCWPEDGGPFVTLPLVYTEHPDGKGHNLGMYRLQHPRRARRRACTGRSGRAAGSTTSVAESRGKRAARDGLPRRAAGADPRGDRAAARERARADAGLAHRRRAAAACRPRPGHPHPLVARRRVRADGRGAAARAAARRARSATTTATTRCGTTIPVFRVRQIARRRDAIYPGHRRRQAAAGGLLHRRSAAGAAVAAVPAGDARRARPLVVRRDRLPLARRRPSSGTATRARRWPARSGSSAKASCR